MRINQASIELDDIVSDLQDTESQTSLNVLSNSVHKEERKNKPTPASKQEMKDTKPKKSEKIAKIDVKVETVSSQKKSTTTKASSRYQTTTAKETKQSVD